jgi:hypothetical protein
VALAAAEEEDFETTEGSKMETLLCKAVEQEDKCVKLQLDNYLKEVMLEYSDYIKKSLRPKKVPISPEQGPEPPDPLQQKHYHLFVANLQFVEKIDQIRHLVCGIAVGTFLCISGLGSMGCSPPSHGISQACSTFQLQN